MKVDGFGMQLLVLIHNIYLQVCFLIDSLREEINFYFLASSSGKARLWRLDTKEVEREYIGHQKAITALAFRD